MSLELVLPTHTFILLTPDLNQQLIYLWQVAHKRTFKSS